MKCIINVSYWGNFVDVSWGRMKSRGLKGFQLEVGARSAPTLLVCAIFVLNVATGVGRLDEAELTACGNNFHLDTALSPPWTLDTWLYQLKHLVPLSTTFFLSVPILSCSWANLFPPLVHLCQILFLHMYCIFVVQVLHIRVCLSFAFGVVKSPCWSRIWQILAAREVSLHVRGRVPQMFDSTNMELEVWSPPSTAC